MPVWDYHTMRNFSREKDYALIYSSNTLDYLPLYTHPPTHPPSSIASISDSSQQRKMSASGGSIAIIGAGSVGSAVAFALLLRAVVADIILVDINHELCEAQVQDLSDATFLSNVRIRKGEVEDAQSADIIISKFFHLYRTILYHDAPISLQM